MSGIAWCDVPAGPFTMGSDPAAPYAPDPDEAPAHRVAVARSASGDAGDERRVPGLRRRPAVRASHWARWDIPEGRESHPVTYVSWEDASRVLRVGRRPASVRGGAGSGRRAATTVARGRGATSHRHRSVPSSPVGTPRPWARVPAGRARSAPSTSPGTHGSGPGARSGPTRTPRGTAREDPGSSDPRAVRGGSFIHGAGEIRCSYRHGLLPGVVDHYVGFRLAADPGAPLAYDAAMVDVPAGEVLLGTDLRPPGGPAAADEVPRTRCLSRQFPSRRRPSRTRSTRRSSTRRATRPHHTGPAARCRRSSPTTR